MSLGCIGIWKVYHSQNLLGGDLTPTVIAPNNAVDVYSSDPSQEAPRPVRRKKRNLSDLAERRREEQRREAQESK